MDLGEGYCFLTLCSLLLNVTFRSDAEKTFARPYRGALREAVASTRQSNSKQS